MILKCNFCSAYFWFEERISTSSKQDPIFTLCCARGRVRLAETSEPPEPIRSLLLRTHTKSKQLHIFILYIRAYNCTFALASLGMSILLFYVLFLLQFN
jgi:hypothetical protein